MRNNYNTADMKADNDYITKVYDRGDKEVEIITDKNKVVEWFVKSKKDLYGPAKAVKFNKEIKDE